MSVEYSLSDLLLLFLERMLAHLRIFFIFKSSHSFMESGTSRLQLIAQKLNRRRQPELKFGPLKGATPRFVHLQNLA